MSNLISLDEYEERALKILPEHVKDYYRSGAGNEQSLAWNREDFNNFRIRPRFLRDVSVRDLSVDGIFGAKVPFCVGISPTALQRLAHPDGEVATARGSLFFSY